MSSKQMLVVSCGTAALVLVILLMVLLPAGGMVDATSNRSTDSAQTEEGGGVTGLSGGNDCYCAPSSDQQLDTEEPVPPIAVRNSVGECPSSLRRDPLG